MIGKGDAVVPSSIAVDDGVVDLLITKQGTKIEFTGGGLKTNVGKRDGSPTTGMSVDAGFDTEDVVDITDEGLEDTPKPNPKTKKKKKKKKLSHFDRMTTLKGLTP